MIRKSLIFILFITPYLAIAQCGTGDCKLCQVTATITSVTGGNIIVGSSTIPGNVEAQQTKSADQILEVESNTCGGLDISIELDFVWDQGSQNNWIHGVSFQASPNWLAAQGVIIPANNGWLFQNSITGVCSNNTYGAGYYWDPPGTNCFSNRSNFNGVNCVPFFSSCEEDDSYLNDGDPSDNYGIDCQTDCPNFGFNLSYCPIDAGSNTETLTFVLTEDGETGGYARSDDCVFNLNFPIKINSSGLQIPDYNPLICLDSCFTLDAGLGCEAYLWSTGDTTKSIEVCPIIDTDYGVTVTAASGCEITDTISVTVEDCCDAYVGEFTIQDDTIFICPFETLTIDVINSQSNSAYENIIYYYYYDSPFSSSINSSFEFNPPQYQFDHINQCDTFTIYALNFVSSHINIFLALDSMNLEFEDVCHDIDSLIIIIQDDTPPSTDYPYLDEVLLDDNSMVILSYDTIKCIEDMPEAIDIEWSDNCVIRNIMLIENDSLKPCSLSYFGRLWIATDHCSNRTIIRNWTTLLSDTLTYNIDIVDEYCIGETNGSISLSNINLTNVLWSLDGGANSSSTIFENLTPGTHYLEGITSCQCSFYDTIYVEEGTGVDLITTDMICNDNGTLGIPDDDFYTIIITATGQNTLLDSCALYINSIFTKNLRYGEAANFDIDAQSTSINLSIADLAKPECTSSVEISNLDPCSGVCNLESAIISQVCDDNGTRGYPDDDFYKIELTNIATNTISDSSQVIIDGEIQNLIPYGEIATIYIPADSTSKIIIIQDKKIADCNTIINTDDLIPCSGTCSLDAEVVNIFCDDNGTRSNPNDDSWSFSVTAQTEDGSGTIRIQKDLSFGYFQSGDTVTFMNLPMDSNFNELIVRDSFLNECIMVLNILAPPHCSNCISQLTMVGVDENCANNLDGAIYFETDIDTIIAIDVDGIRYKNGSAELSFGVHDISIIYGDSCTIDTSYEVGRRPPPNLYIPESYEVVLPNTVQIEAITGLSEEDIFSITWHPNDYLSCDDCLNPICSSDIDIEYILIIEDKNGCLIEDTTQIIVTIIPEVYFPNIINVNSKLNNWLYPIANNIDTEVVELSVYDRWGNLIFINTSFPPNVSEEGWNGRFENQTLNTGVYVYQCIVRHNDNSERRYIGTITLVH